VIYVSKLTDRVRTICAAHWNPPKTRCQGCPIYGPCHSAEPGIMTQAKNDAYVARVNAAAEQVEI
jgi:hypothetical protein